MKPDLACEQAHVHSCLQKIKKGIGVSQSSVFGLQQKWRRSQEINLVTLCFCKDKVYLTKGDCLVQKYTVKMLYSRTTKSSPTIVRRFFSFLTFCNLPFLVKLSRSSCNKQWRNECIKSRKSTCLSIPTQVFPVLDRWANLPICLCFQ